MAMAEQRLRSSWAEWRWATWNRVRLALGLDALPRPCCRLESNLGPAEQVAPNVSFRRCRVCGSRHFEAVVDPIHFGIRGTS